VSLFFQKIHHHHQSSIMLRSIVILLLSYHASSLSTVVYGPQSKELLLLTAKLAAREGIDTSLICASGTEIGCRRLMYGVEYADQEQDEDGKAKPVSGGEAMQDALTNADSIIFIGYDNPIDEKAAKTLMNAAGDNLEKVVLLSKMGVTQGGGGFFGGGGGDAKLLQSETILRDLCRQRDNTIDLSIVRAGHILKGGGPGKEGNDFGLDKSYYNTLFDVVEASVTMAHDRYTLGALCTAGDTIETPNMIAKMGTTPSFEPYPYDTNRIIATSAIVATILHDNIKNKGRPLEFSVGTEKGEAPPTREEWEEILSTL
jgi:hypothetical protein